MAQPTGRVTLFDADGNVITSLELDENGMATYTQTMTEEDIGRGTYKAVYTGDNDYIPDGQDTFTLEVTDENGNGGNKSRATHVIKIVAGPGIYISPGNGQGTVTISTKPLGSGDQDLYVVRYTQTISAKYNNQACFLAGGADGALITSSDGQDWTDTGPVNTLGVGGTSLNFSNLANVESLDFSDDGLVYWYTVPWVYDETPTQREGITVAWGRQGYTDTNGVYKGDNIDKDGANLLLNGNEWANKIVKVAETFLTGGDLLNLIASYEGDIVSYAGTPTFDSEADDNVLRSEITGMSGKILMFGSNLQYSGAGSFTVKAVSDTGKIYSSSRSGTSSSTWTLEIETADSLKCVRYGNGRWIACGHNDTLYINDGAGWSSSGTGIAGNWNAVCYGGGKWVVVGESGSMAISEDGGNTWIEADSGTNSSLNDIDYNPLENVFAAVGNKRATVAIKGL